MKVLLAYLSQYHDRGDYYLSLMPAGLPSIASSLEGAGHEVILANLSSMGWRKGAGYVSTQKPRVLGVSVFSFNRVDSFKLIREVKRQLPGTAVVVGGHHPTFLAEEIARRYPGVDHIITGEGEASFVRLLDDLEAGRVPGRIISGERIMELDRLPLAPAFSGLLKDVNVNEQYKFIITSRGCPGRCTFCSSPSFWGRRVTFRSSGSIMDEVRLIWERYGIIYFSIRDDNFTLKKKRVMDFCRMLRERGLFLLWNCQARVDSVDEEMLLEMKRSGLEHIQYGVESGSPRILEKYDKSISLDSIRRAAELTRRAGIMLSFYLMSGMEGEERGDMLKTVALMKKALPHDCIVSPVAYYPGTALYGAMKRMGRITDDIWFSRDLQGIYLRTDRDSRGWPGEIMDEAAGIACRAAYREEDFGAHRELAGAPSWVTDIMEGDMHAWQGNEEKARRCYGSVIASFPRNIWGHYRMGRLEGGSGRYESAEEHYLAAADINPAFYGSWLKLAEIRLRRGDKGTAREYLEKSHARNPYDGRIKKLMRRLQADKC